MHIDLTPPELKALVKLCEASEMTGPVATMHAKASHYLKNFGDDVENTQLPPEPGPDPRIAAQQWKGPV